MESNAMFATVGARLPRILLPAETVAPETYAVIACDQFSVCPEYWDEAERLIGGAPSTLHMILPEARLAQSTGAAARIHRTMARYLADGTLRELGEGLVYLERITESGTRRGLMIALDLEQYNYAAGSGSLIRATEGTIMERLPARVEIRRGAALELPHIMVLLDDREDCLMSALAAQKAAMPKLYDFELMLGGGHLAGWHITDAALLQTAAHVLMKLKAQSPDGLLYAMGDGNHSFAAAKACWEKLKPSLSPAERENHPARYALVELVNLYDPALRFEPIHRLLTNVDAAAVQREVGFDAENPPSLQELQPKLDAWLAQHHQVGLEYIHGAPECRALGERPGNLAIVFPPFCKDSFFETVRRDGAFVRKSFSMGSAKEKRYYLEARKITVS